MFHKFDLGIMQREQNTFVDLFLFWYSLGLPMTGFYIILGFFLEIFFPSIIP